jgi:hypothetical protein
VFCAETDKPVDFHQQSLEFSSNHQNQQVGLLATLPAQADYIVDEGMASRNTLC